MTLAITLAIAAFITRGPPSSPAWRDLRSADLRSAGLRSAGLRSAGLRSAGLRSAGLRSAGLRSAGLRSALVPVGLALVTLAALPALALGQISPSGLAGASTPAAGVGVGPRAPVRFVHEPWRAGPSPIQDGRQDGRQDGWQDAGQGRPADRPGPAPLRYGQADYASVIVAASTAFDGQALDQGLTVGYNRFLVDRLEWLLEAGLWSLADDGNQAAFGLSAGLGFRWHFVMEDRWSAFADVGIALLASSDHVPPGGTQLNFMPRAGVGLTYRLDADVRLIGGLRWHHISNARTRGDDRNPSRDAPLLYLGLVARF
ncbi:MAG: hypothetical protein KatS3mg103_0783 [Phycisphaerales bacterium]|nr:MAG: hypothetical protein KatS3mg103_0783 [Phycisphaerales bacterium]